MSQDDKSVSRNSLAFTSTLGIATLVYLVTSDPLVAVILPCLHGGWHTLRTGCWLLGADPCRRRARTCFVFYVAAAFWKAAAAALLTIVLFAVVETLTGLLPNANEIQAIACVLLLGFLLNTLTGFVAVCTALFCGVRVWVHPDLHTMLHADLGLVSGLNPRWSGVNHAIFVVATAMAFPLLVFGFILLCILPLDKDHVAIESLSVIPLSSAFLLGGAIAMVACYVWLSSRIIARTPQDCWPETMLCKEYE